MASQIQKALMALQVEGRISANDYAVSSVCVCIVYSISKILLNIPQFHVVSLLLLQFYELECRRYNVDLFKAFDIANGDLLTFQQQLASFKPPISIHSTHL